MINHPLAQYRTSQRLTQQELAARVGVSRWTVNRIERGERMPSIRLARRLCEASGLSMAQLRPDIFEPPATFEVAVPPKAGQLEEGANAAASSSSFSNHTDT